MFGLGDLLTSGLFVAHFVQRIFNTAFISNTEEMTIKIIQNKAPTLTSANFVGEINCLGDSLTGAFVVHLRHPLESKAFISNTEEKTIKIIQNKATFPFILTL